MQTSALREHLISGGRVERDGQCYRLIIPPVGADGYTDAQLDDYEHGQPSSFTNRPPQDLRIRARFSHPEMKGTAGFGFWNHPFSRTGAVLAPPSNVWFFNSSPESDLRVARGVPGHGFKAAMLNGGQMPAGVARVAGQAVSLLLRVPLAARIIMSVGQAVVHANEALLTLDMSAWHEYELTLRPQAAVFRVDGTTVLSAPHPPLGALGFAAWVDNYRASASAGNYQFAYVACAHEQWLELEIMDGND
jgi:hypothetical protein